jgi:hypothetical protein
MIDKKRRKTIAGAGLAAIGGCGTVYLLMNRPSEATGGSTEGTICRAPVQRSPGETLSILTVLVNETSATVEFDIESDQSVDSTAIIIDDEMVVSQPWTGQRESLTFDRDGPVTFEVRAYSDDGTVIDSAEILAECVPAEELLANTE